MVLRYVTQVRERGLGVVFITHNARHAMAVADSFTVLNRGRSVATFRRGKIGLDDLQTSWRRPRYRSRPRGAGCRLAGDSRPVIAAMPSVIQPRHIH